MPPFDRFNAWTTAAGTIRSTYSKLDAKRRSSARAAADDSRAGREESAVGRSKVAICGRARSDGARHTMTGASRGARSHTAGASPRHPSRPDGAALDDASSAAADR